LRASLLLRGFEPPLLVPKLFYETAGNDGSYTFQHVQRQAIMVHSWLRQPVFFSLSGAIEISTYKVAWQLTVAMRGLALLSVWAWLLESCMIKINC